MATVQEQATGKGRGAYVPPVDAEDLRRRNRAAMELLDRWGQDGDADEQRETLEVLTTALGAGRTISDRPLFP